jgi:LacI family transcriptional regulator
VGTGNQFSADFGHGVQQWPFMTVRRMRRRAAGVTPGGRARTGPGARGRAPTLADVARLAEVSVATASKALNGRDHVRAATRSRVLEAAEQLSFIPNSLARSLLAGRTSTVGLLTSDLVGRFSIPILMGAEDAFGAGRVSVFLCDARGDAIREQHHVQALLNRRVDGLIVVGSRTDPRPSLGRKLPVPVVYTYAPSEDPKDLSIVCDNVSAGRLAIEHLIACGRTRIAHITGDPDYGAARDRARGARAALKDAGLSLVGDVRYGAWSEGWGRAAAAMLLGQEPEVDAIFCGSDTVARGVLDAVRERGRQVPDDVAVLGFDNWEVLTEDARPPLTSVDMNLEEMGRAAARALFAALDGSPRSGLEALPCRIVLRGSTARLG